MGMPATPESVTTLDEFFALPEQSGSGRQELLDGHLVVSPEASLRHQRAAFQLGQLLYPALVALPDLELFTSPGDIVLGPRTVVQPDVFVIPWPRSSSVHWRDVGLPVLVVEILSPRTATRDRVGKRALYQQAGIPEYWIVDLDAWIIERWRPDDQRPEILVENFAWRVPGTEREIQVDLPSFFGRVLD
jgi:Uma2 family endonuclease